ncbi:uncharacterized protein N7482_010332 [Penicillium canariense]|uniref:BHLH domain-containing protein n=1 Tax=Penicillium canariense TaxID=189055 RepID=A0A9W9HLM3_9EURO|nr:uncharacterized protein N7482_010332 [Penicillium canariense]KAJ5151080.1 hypothetical protein N7482_010332 [Penicillium canariense]
MQAEDRPLNDVQDFDVCCPEKGNKQHKNTNERAPLERGLQWGSDPNFCYHGFSCPIGSWTEERLVRNAMRNMVYMAASMKTELNLDLNIPNYLDERHNEPATPDVGYLNGLDIPPTQRPHDLRSPTPPSTSSPSSTSSPDEQEKDTQPPSKKRKCVQKAGQKLCHCRSEKKRREVVSQRYRDLSQIVPGLKNHNFTRKYVLDAAAKYVELLLEGNYALRRQLGEMNDKEDRDIQQLFIGCGPGF